MTAMTYDQWKSLPTPTMCGGCKATGLKHAWTKEGDLKPVEPREHCPACHGSGWSPRP